MNRLFGDRGGGDGAAGKSSPFSAALNVAQQLKRQILPRNDKNRQTVEEGGKEIRQGERVHFAARLPNRNGSIDSGTFDEHHEMVLTSSNPRNPFLMQQSDGNLGQEVESHIDMKSNTYPNLNNDANYVENFNNDFVDGHGGGNKNIAALKIDEYQAAWNVTNAIQGMFIVSLPFAVLRGGYWAIFAMLGVAYICCYTGKILVECLYEFDVQTGKQVRVRDSYVSLAEECFGKTYGAILVNCAQIIELLMTCILYVVVCGDLMVGTFPDGSIPLDSRSWMMLVGIFLIPLGFLQSLKSVSTLSYLCTIAHLIINVIVVGYCLLYITEWGWGDVKWKLDLENFPISLGVIVFSYTSHIFLPTLEGNMEDPSKFQWMLDWSHFWAAVFKAAFGYLCFLTFRNDTQQVITNNLRDPFLKGLVNTCLVLKATLSYPLPYYAACELLERSIFGHFMNGPLDMPSPLIYYPNGDLKVGGLVWKLSVIIFTILMACFIPHFQILMGFIGSFTGTMLSFIWPCYFHLKLKGNAGKGNKIGTVGVLERKVVIFDYFIIYLGMIFGIIGIWDSGKALINAFEIGLPF